ncbi:hypothetical protein CJF42_23355 [Pseudoalteromonas sp. NBT06-2]|uniref:hypothetical protein n=1 Tax=Pseudoalteromonas sp. NBT06-2 TaxID=2025950 RepID=UPI000BA5215F|nr:hypothetical protein [Pseudoalteromonas sp. NBT06-2]PAJ72045.1 hypothetical protein CJF42_23355 [Pseudoalteromonas sp. NBT06-2]
MALEQDIAELVTASNNLTQIVDDKIQQIDSKVISAESKIDSAILNFAKSHSSQVVSYYDNTRHSQTSINPEIDPLDETKTKWIALPTTDTAFHMYPSVNRLTKIHTTNCYSYHPGHYEDPKHSIDHSCTKVQFVLANDSASSEQINTQLALQNTNHTYHGGWWNGTGVFDAKVVRVPGLHPYSRLFIRYINGTVIEGKSPQNVLNFGGNPTLSVTKVINYPYIKA